MKGMDTSLSSRKFSFGESVRTPSPLRLLSFEKVVRWIQKPPLEFQRTIALLRELLSIDIEEYRRRKTYLPYIVPGRFRPPFRRNENLEEIWGFFVDVDHVTRLDTSPEILKERLAQDSRIVMMFVSPSGEGLKVLFAFEQGLQDVKLFSSVYERFVSQWATEHQLTACVDVRTKDPARACFLSWDPHLYINPYPVLLRHHELAPPESAETRKESEPEIKAEKEKEEKRVSDEVLMRIREILEIGKRKSVHTVPRRVYVPEPLQKIRSCLEECLQQAGLKVIQIREIHYGFQIQVASEQFQGEANLFWGKRRGFTAVPSTRTRMDPTLSQMLAELLLQIAHQCWEKESPGENDSRE